MHLSNCGLWISCFPTIIQRDYLPNGHSYKQDVEPGSSWGLDPLSTFLKGAGPLHFFLGNGSTWSGY